MLTLIILVPMTLGLSLLRRSLRRVIHPRHLQSLDSRLIRPIYLVVVGRDHSPYPTETFPNRVLFGDCLASSPLSAWRQTSWPVASFEAPTDGGLFWGRWFGARVPLSTASWVMDGVASRHP